MKDKIVRAKAFAKRHRTAITFSTGVIAGATPVLYVLSKYLDADIWAVVPTEDLQKLIDEPSGGIRYPLGRAFVYVVNTEHPQFKQ